MQIPQKGLCGYIPVLIFWRSTLHTDLRYMLILKLGVSVIWGSQLDMYYYTFVVSSIEV
jgi:hypothetical protein